MCMLLCESSWTGPAADREDDYVHEAIDHGRLAFDAHRDPDGDPEAVCAEATLAIHAARAMMKKFSWERLLRGLYREHFAWELKMTNDSDPTHNIASEYLERMRDRKVRMLITASGWGYIGNLPISWMVVERWMVNQFLQRISPTSETLWEISDRGLEFLDGKIREKDLVWPERSYVAPPANAIDQSVSDGSVPKKQARVAGEPFSEADELFTAAGTCRLCGAQCHLFGWISHAKSKHGATYEAVGEVQLVKRRKKTVPIMLGDRPTKYGRDGEVEENPDLIPQEATTVKVYPKKSAAPVVPSAPIEFIKPLSEMTADEILAQLGVKK